MNSTALVLDNNKNAISRISIKFSPKILRYTIITSKTTNVHLFGCDIHGANAYLAIMSIHTSLISECSSHDESVSFLVTGEIDRGAVWGEGWLLALLLCDLAVAKAGLSGLGSKRSGLTALAFRPCQRYDERLLKRVQPLLKGS